MLYVVVGPRGALHSWHTDFTKLRVPPNAVVVERPLWMEPPPKPYVWDPVEMDWINPPPPPQARPLPLNQLQFASRFTEAEQMALEAAEEGPDAATRRALRVVNKNLSRAAEVRVDDPRTQRGVEICVSVLVAMDVVAPENAAARMAQLLTPPTLEEIGAA